MHEFADVEYCNKVVARMRAPEAFKIEMNLSTSKIGGKDINKLL